MADLLHVKVWPTDAECKDDFIEFSDVENLSYVNHGTYGKPAIIAPGTPDYQQGEVQVLYVNTGAVLAVEVERG